MKVEHDAVRRELRRAGLSFACSLVQTGIGKDRIVRHIALNAAEHARSALFILAGACGGLTVTDPLPTIARVIDQHGHDWACGERWTRADSTRLVQNSHPEAGGEDRGWARTESRASAVSSLATPTTGVTLIGVDEIIATPMDKARLAERTGASIVDMECHAFIDACERLARERAIDVYWSIVRGVSDTPDETLPAEVLNWIDADGNTRTLRAVRDLALRPRLVPHMVDVLRRSNRVLPLVGKRVAELCGAWQGESRVEGARS